MPAAPVAIIDAVLAPRAAEAPALSPGVAWGWGRLQATAGAAPVGELGSELGWSRKQLVAWFREEIGLRPKTAARVLRFHALLVGLRMAGAAQSWAALAAAAGYSDQSHLVRDVAGSRA